MQLGAAAIADGDQHIAQEARAADALDGRAGEEAPEAGVVEGGELGQGWGFQLRALAEIGLLRRLGEFVPGADGEAIVAAIDAVAHERAQLARDRPLMLDGEIGDAAPRIELVGRREGGGRAGIEAAPAGAAMILLGRSGIELQRGEDLAQEEPGAELAGDEIGMLALPADPRRLGQRLLHHRGGIDEDLHPAVEVLRHPARQRLETLLDGVVVVAVAGIDGDLARFGPGRSARGSDGGP